MRNQVLDTSEWLWLWKSLERSRLRTL